MKQITVKELADFLKGKEVVGDEKNGVLIALEVNGKSYAGVSGNASALVRILAEMCSQNLQVQKVLIDAILNGCYANGFHDGREYAKQGENDNRLPNKIKSYEA